MLKVIELFGGIGACTQALKRIGIDFKVVDYVEIDKYAVASYNAMNNTNFETQDICEWDKDIEADLIMHGSPCQDFSIAGTQAGGDEGTETRSSLMWETIRIVNKLKPKYVIWENVKNVLSKKHIHNFYKYIDILNEGGYKSYYQVLNAKDYGVPQNRERLFTISIRNDIEKNFKFPEKEELKIKLKDLLENEVDEKYYLSDKMKNYVMDLNDTQKGTAWEGRADNDTLNSNIAHTLGVRSASGNQRAGVSNFVIDGVDEQIQVKELKIRNATKGGYAIATNGDSINLAYPNSTTRRGRVGKQVSQTLQCTDNMGVVVNRTICLNSKAGRNGIDGLQPSRKDRIYDSNGIATTVATSDFYNPSYLVKENIEQLEHEEMLEDDIETLENEISYRNGTKDSNLRIRKLTPKECWRLMGFKDEEFEKAEKVNSNAQLYKQAGNSIVVDVLEKIFKNLLEGE